MYSALNSWFIRRRRSSISRTLQIVPRNPRILEILPGQGFYKSGFPSYRILTSCLNSSVFGYTCPLEPCHFIICTTKMRLIKTYPDIVWCRFYEEAQRTIICCSPNFMVGFFFKLFFDFCPSVGNHIINGLLAPSIRTFPSRCSILPIYRLAQV